MFARNIKLNYLIFSYSSSMLLDSPTATLVGLEEPDFLVLSSFHTMTVETATRQLEELVIATPRTPPEEPSSAFSDDSSTMNSDEPSSALSDDSSVKPSEDTTMAFHDSWHLARMIRFTNEEVDELLSSGPPPLFVHGPLRLPNILAQVLYGSLATMAEEFMLASNMTPGALTHHQVYTLDRGIFSAMLDNGTDEDVAHGLLIFGLTERQCQRIDRYTGGRFSREERQVEIIVAERESRTINAHAYIWRGDRESMLNSAEQ